MSAEEFGLWSILLSIMFLAMTFDLGFRYGLSNRLAAQVALPEEHPAGRNEMTFMSVFASQTAIATAGALVCFLVLPHVPWARLFSIHQSDLAEQVPQMVSVVCGLLFLYLPFSLWSSGFYAYQEVALASILGATQSLILLGVFAVSIFTLPFKHAVLVYFSVYILTGVFMTAILLQQRAWSFRWAKWEEQIACLRSISRPSLDFFILSVSSALTATAGTLLSGAVIGLKEAGDYSLIQKIFSLLVTLHLALLSPLAPAYTRNAQLGNWDWVLHKLAFTIRRIWPLVFIVCGGLFVIFHPILIRIWAGKWLADFTLAGLLALWAITSGWMNSYSVVLNSLGLVRFQAILSIAMVIPVVTLPMFLGRWLGVHGIALSAFICALPAAIILPRYAARAIKNSWLRV